MRLAYAPRWSPWKATCIAESYHGRRDTGSQDTGWPFDVEKGPKHSRHEETWKSLGVIGGKSWDATYTYPTLRAGYAYGAKFLSCGVTVCDGGREGRRGDDTGRRDGERSATGRTGRWLCSSSRVGGSHARRCAGRGMTSRCAGTTTTPGRPRCRDDHDAGTTTTPGRTGRRLQLLFARLALARAAHVGRGDARREEMCVCEPGRRRR